MKSASLKIGWNIPFLIFGHLIAAILLGTWLWPTTRQYWHTLDVFVFQTLNYNLKGRHSLLLFFALVNHRSADILTAIFMLVPLFQYLRSQDRVSFNGAASHLFSYGLFTGFSLISIRLAIRWLLVIQRKSPSLSSDYVVFLSDHIPWLHQIRETSSNSFPGDHTALLFLWAGYLFLVCSWRYGLPAILFALAASIPRLVSGAHWFTDDIIGGGIITSILLAWAFGSPVCQNLAKELSPLLSKQLKRMPFLTSAS